jgi:hypothetical protein
MFRKKESSYSLQIDDDFTLSDEEWDKTLDRAIASGWVAMDPLTRIRWAIEEPERVAKAGVRVPSEQEVAAYVAKREGARRRRDLRLEIGLIPGEETIEVDGRIVSKEDFEEWLAEQMLGDWLAMSEEERAKNMDMSPDGLLAQGYITPPLESDDPLDPEDEDEDEDDGLPCQTREKFQAFLVRNIIEAWHRMSPEERKSNEWRSPKAMREAGHDIPPDLDY